MDAVSEHISSPVKEIDCSAPIRMRVRIPVSDTSGTIATTSARYKKPRGATVTRNSAGKYTITVPALSDVSVLTSLLESSGVARTVRTVSVATSGSTTTIVILVGLVADAPVAADLVTAADEIEVTIFGDAKTI